MVIMTKWLEKWEQDKHKTYKESTFTILDNFLNYSPKRIFDIGCGLAYESELFQKKYKSELYLLDGDFGYTSDNTRDVGYGAVDNFQFYNSIDTLKESYNNRGLKYNFIDANNIQIKDNITFDLVYSILSCGFHYPVETYTDLIKKHTSPTSRIIMDIRNIAISNLKNIEIINVVATFPKYKTVEIKIK